MAEKIRIPDYLNSNDDIRRHLIEVKKDLKVGIDKQNQKLRIEKANVVGASLALVAAGIGLSSDPFSAAQVLGAIVNSVALTTAWLSLSKLLKIQEKEVTTLYQGFRHIRDEYQNQESIANKVLQVTA